jgi:hypothetical protein
VKFVILVPTAFVCCKDEDDVTLTEIFKDNGDYCLECWQDMSNPRI